MSVEAVKRFVSQMVHDEGFATVATRDFEGSTRDLELDTHEREALRRVRDAHVAGGPAGVMALKNQLGVTIRDYWF